MAENGKLKLLAIVGPTASGKTAIAIQLARRLGGEVVSCDSMQVYRRMDVGTAKPNAEERAAAVHHLIDIVDPCAPFSCADYVEHAQRAIAEISADGKLPILCGGTGLYLDRLLCGGMEETTSDAALRESLFDYASEHGAHALHERLRAVDPESADAIHENNVKRVVRALEIYETTGVTKSEMDRRTQAWQSPYDATVIGLHYPDREILYERIDRRVTQMLEEGLIEETRALQREGVFDVNLTAAQAIGYKELFGFLRGEETLAEARARLVVATRHYAKRQLNWFRAKDYVRWVDMQTDTALRSADAVCDEIEAIFSAAEVSP